MLRLNKRLTGQSERTRLGPEQDSKQQGISQQKLATSYMEYDFSSTEVFVYKFKVFQRLQTMLQESTFAVSDIHRAKCFLRNRKTRKCEPC